MSRTPLPSTAGLLDIHGKTALSQAPRESSIF